MATSQNMPSTPAGHALCAALREAAVAHHDFESNYLNGLPDPYWAGWYSAYVLGQLGPFTTPTELARMLEEVSDEGDWAENAAAHVVFRLRVQ